MEDELRNEQFLELLAAHEAQIFGFIYALVCHREDAEDLMQQATVTMWRHFDRFEVGTNFGAWASQIAKNCALNHFQTRRRRKVFSATMIELLADSQAAQENDMRLRRRQALSACLDKLSPEDRSLVVECYEPDATVKKVAERINRPAAGVSNSLSRIRRALYRCIEATLARGEHAL